MSHTYPCFIQVQLENGRALPPPSKISLYIHWGNYFHILHVTDHTSIKSGTKFSLYFVIGTTGKDFKHDSELWNQVTYLTWSRLEILRIFRLQSQSVRGMHVIPEIPWCHCRLITQIYSNDSQPVVSHMSSLSTGSRPFPGWHHARLHL
jgi:hypothetical protein